MILRGETIVSVSVEGPPPVGGDEKSSMLAGPGRGVPAGRGMGLGAGAWAFITEAVSLLRVRRSLAQADTRGSQVRRQWLLARWHMDVLPLGSHLECLDCLLECPLATQVVCPQACLLPGTISTFSGGIIC